MKTMKSALGLVLAGFAVLFILPAIKLVNRFNGQIMIMQNYSAGREAAKRGR